MQCLSKSCSQKQLSLQSDRSQLERAEGESGGEDGAKKRSRNQILLSCIEAIKKITSQDKVSQTGFNPTRLIPMLYSHDRLPALASKSPANAGRLGLMWRGDAGPDVKVRVGGKAIAIFGNSLQPFDQCWGSGVANRSPALSSSSLPPSAPPPQYHHHNSSSPDY
eukprot:372581-Rhodomonas_salina.1